MVGMPAHMGANRRVRSAPKKRKNAYEVAKLDNAR